jgi:hypothetical protein
MSTHTPSTIIAVTSGDARHDQVVDRATEVASQTGATVILFDLDAAISPLESPLPTDWSGQGEQEQFGDRLDPGDLDAAGQGALADRVRVVRAAGVAAFGWLPPKADGNALAEYAARQAADLVLVSTEDTDLIEALRQQPALDARAVAAGIDRPTKAPGERIHVEAVPPA